MSIEDLVVRALRSHNPRPLMRGLSESDMRTKIASQLKECEVFYRRAQIGLDGKAPVM